MKKKVWVIYLAVTLITLPFLVLLVRTAQLYMSRAGGTTANIIVDTQNYTGNLPRPWMALAQGGEENPPMLKGVIADIKTLTPSYIRIDHIYDLYANISKTNNTLILDFSKLDDTVNDILSSGALPLLALSYMPPAISRDGNTTSEPANWNDWEEVVKKTVERYSGRNQRNLTNVYYEVWNEPDLFGGWKIGGNKDYRLLYFHSAAGAAKAQNTNNYFIGGPATTALYPAWANGLLKYTSDNNVRLDFFSWHRYSANPTQFGTDGEIIRNILTAYPKYANVPTLITEWGIDSENNPFFDTNVSAAHEISAIRQMLDKINLAFTFEIKDGPSPKNSAFWGRWGLITNDKSGLYKKPRYYAIKMLEAMNGRRLAVAGEGSWVTGFAANDGSTIRLILSNFDPESLHAENVPVTFTKLDPASYSIKNTYLNGTVKQTESAVTTGNLSQSLILNPNDVVLIELTKSAAFAAFTTGRSGRSGDQALVLNSVLSFSDPSFSLGSPGSISFDLKPNWGGENHEDKIIFDVPFMVGNNPVSHLTLKKSYLGFSNKLIFGVFNQSNSSQVTIPIDKWVAGNWYKVEARWSLEQLSIAVNGAGQQASGTYDIRKGNTLTFYPINGTIDNLSVVINGKEIIRRSFDGSMDK